jgi:hypothetical protein
LQKDKEILSKDLSAMHKAPPIQSKWVLVFLDRKFCWHVKM